MEIKVKGNTCHSSNIAHVEETVLGLNMSEFRVHEISQHAMQFVRRTSGRKLAEDGKYKKKTEEGLNTF